MIEGLIPPISIDPDALKAATNSLEYFSILCNRPIECDEYNVAREAAIRILSIQIADNDGSDEFVFSDSMSVKMGYDLAHMGNTVTFEMIATLKYKDTEMSIRQISCDENDYLYLYVEDFLIVVYVPGIFRESKKLEFKRRVEKNG